MTHWSSTREHLRWDALEVVAAFAGRTWGNSVVITGSFALALYAQSPARLPNDIDLAVTNRTRLLEVARSLQRLSIRATNIRNVRTFNGAIDSNEQLIHVAGSEEGVASDLLPCQVVLNGHLDCPTESFTVLTEQVAVHQRQVLLADKLHALWKTRASRRVSSRVRDLYDLQLAVADPSAQGALYEAQSIAAQMERPRRPLGCYPVEWVPAWRLLNNQSGFELDIDEAWNALRIIVDSAERDLVD